MKCCSGFFCGLFVLNIVMWSSRYETTTRDDVGSTVILEIFCDVCVVCVFLLLNCVFNLIL